MAADITVVAPSTLEYLATRAVVGGFRVVKSGIGRGGRPDTAGVVVICGLAGGLEPRLLPGTVVVAESVGTEAGQMVPCDKELVRLFVAGGKQLGFAVEIVRLLTAEQIVTGDERTLWAARGFDAVDMETARWHSPPGRLAAVRVILDTPRKSISEQWLNSRKAMVRPELWLEMGWLAVHAPRYAVRAARVTQAGLALLAPGRPETR